MDPTAVADIFATFRPVRCRRMFGGLGVYADGVMFALVADGRLYLKADVPFGGELAARGAEPFIYESGGRTITVSYWSMPESALDDPDEAAELGARALGLARRAAAEREAAPRRRVVPHGM